MIQSITLAIPSTRHPVRHSRQFCADRRRPPEDRCRRPGPYLAQGFDRHVAVGQKRISVLSLAPWDLSVRVYPVKKNHPYILFTLLSYIRRPPR